MTSLYTKSATLGLGQTVAEIGDLDLVARAILWEAIGQTFTVLGTAIAKWSLGLFLLRLVIERWQIIVIWTAMGCLMAASISVLFAFWMQVRLQLLDPMHLHVQETNSLLISTFRT